MFSGNHCNLFNLSLCNVQQISLVNSLIIKFNSFSIAFFIVAETLNPNNKAIKNTDFTLVLKPATILQQTHAKTVLNMKQSVTASCQ